MENTMPKGKQSKHDRKQGRLNKILGIERNIPEEEQRGFATQFHSKTQNPYTEHEVQKFMKHVPGDIFSVEPKRLRTMHAGISDRFSDNRKISDTVEQMKKDPGSLKHLPPVKVAVVEIPRKSWDRKSPLEQRNKKELALFTEDHRRVVAAREAGITLQAQMKSNPSVTGNYTTKNMGMSVEVRKYPPEKGAHQGGNQSTFPSKGKIYKYGD
jgi:hypothetical protein